MARQKSTAVSHAQRSGQPSTLLRPAHSHHDRVPLTPPRVIVLLNLKSLRLEEPPHPPSPKYQPPRIDAIHTRPMSSQYTSDPIESLVGLPAWPWPEPCPWTRSTDGMVYERNLGDSELAFHPAAQNGILNMFLHIDFIAPLDYLESERVATAWAVLRARHPLLASRVVCDPVTGLASAKFVFTPPTGVRDAVDAARRSVVWAVSSRDEMINAYMNGPSGLSNERLSSLTISERELLPDDHGTSSVASAASTTASTTAPPTATSPSLSLPSASPELGGPRKHYDLLLAAPHLIGDATALHRTTHDLISLLASPLSTPELANAHLGHLGRVEWMDHLPPCVEDRLALPSARLARAAARVNFLNTSRRAVGGHVFPRVRPPPSASPPPATSSNSPPPSPSPTSPPTSSYTSPPAPPHTSTPPHSSRSDPPTPSPGPPPTKNTTWIEHTWSATDTARILARCKREGLTVNHALLALCSVACARVVVRVVRREPGQEGKDRGENGRTVPMLAYVALCLRPYLSSASTSTSEWFLPMTYTHVSLPAFPPGPVSSSFSLPSPSSGNFNTITPEQYRSAPHTATTSFWARARSAKAQLRRATTSPFLRPRAMLMAVSRAAPVRAISFPSPSPAAHLSSSHPSATFQPHAQPFVPPPSPNALVGLSFIGALDRTYLPESDAYTYAGVELQSVTTASTQRGGGYSSSRIRSAGGSACSFSTTRLCSGGRV